jgi:hypothetical protein
MTDEASMFELFQVIDIDHNGRITQKEFIDNYMDAFLRLEEERFTTQQKIVESYKQYREVQQKKQTAEFNEELNAQGIIKDAMLKVNIVDARYLDPTDQTFVRVTQDGAEGRTKTKPGAGPIWNEAIVFAISDISTPLVVELVSERSRTVLFSEAIQFDEIMEKEQNSIYQPGDKLNIRIQFLYSHIQMYAQLENEFKEHLEGDFNQLANVIYWQAHMSDPFDIEVVQRFGLDRNNNLQPSEMEDLRKD